MYIHKTIFMKVEVKFMNDDIVLYKIVKCGSYGTLKRAIFNAKYKEL